MRGRSRRHDEQGHPAEAGAGDDAEPLEVAGEPEVVHAESAPPPVESVESLKDKWLRALAEADNAHKRARTDVDEARRFGTAELLRALLPVLDNLQRALASPPAGLDPQFLEGLQLIEQQWLAVLAAYGVQAVPAEIGAPLDPQRQRALLEQPTDEHPPGAVVAEIARCYMLHDRLLREGQVVVARAPDAPAGG